MHGHHTKKWPELWDHLEKYCWVVSWNSPHQLDTLAILRLKMGTFYKHNVKAGCIVLQQVKHMHSCGCPGCR